MVVVGVVVTTSVDVVLVVGMVVDAVSIGEAVNAKNRGGVISRNFTNL